MGVESGGHADGGRASFRGAGFAPRDPRRRDGRRIPPNTPPAAGSRGIPRAESARAAPIPQFANRFAMPDAASGGARPLNDDPLVHASNSARPRIVSRRGLCPARSPAARWTSSPADTPAAARDESRALISRKLRRFPNSKTVSPCRAPRRAEPDRETTGGGPFGVTS